MTDSVPPESPRPAEEPSGSDPWAAPAGAAPALAAAPAPSAAPAAAPAHGAPYWPPYPVAAPVPRNGLGTAAMVLGIVGVVLSLAVFLFWVSWIPALLALVFGVIGVGHARRGVATNRGMAIAGVVLGISGLLVSVGAGVFVVARIQAVHDERRAEADAARARADAAIEAARQRAVKEKELADAQRKKAEAEQEKAAADERARRLPFGQSYTYGDGLKVTMAEPEPYVPRGTVYDLPENATIVQVKITVVNTGSEQVSLYGSGSPIVKDANGAPVFSLIDGSGRMKVLAGSLAPGQEATGLSAYALPAGAADRFSVEFSYGNGLQRKNVLWSGPSH